MAREAGLSHTTARRIRKAFGLQPHRSEAFKLSSAPPFVDKARGIAGFYPSPPDRALALCADEKNRGQALDREQPALAMIPGIPERRTHAKAEFGETAAAAQIAGLRAQLEALRAKSGEASRARLEQQARTAPETPPAPLCRMRGAAAALNPPPRRAPRAA